MPVFNFESIFILLLLGEKKIEGICLFKIATCLFCRTKKNPSTKKATIELMKGPLLVWKVFIIASRCLIELAMLTQKWDRVRSPAAICRNREPVRAKIGEIVKERRKKNWERHRKKFCPCHLMCQQRRHRKRLQQRKQRRHRKRQRQQRRRQWQQRWRQRQRPV